MTLSKRMNRGEIGVRIDVWFTAALDRCQRSGPLSASYTMGIGTTTSAILGLEFGWAPARGWLWWRLKTFWPCLELHFSHDANLICVLQQFPMAELWAGQSGVRIPAAPRRFSLLQNSIPTLGLFPGKKQLQREVNHSSPPNADITNEWSCISTPPIRLRGALGYEFTLFFI